MLWWYWEKPWSKIFLITFCHWNLDGLRVHDSIKVSLLPAYITQHNYDIICSSETFLNSSIDSSNTRFSIDGYNLIISDHPCDSKRGSVYSYYKEHDISLIKRDDICILGNFLVKDFTCKVKTIF